MSTIIREFGNGAEKQVDEQEQRVRKVGIAGVAVVMAKEKSMLFPMRREVCGYCQTDMLISLVKVKRKAPKGAKDLGFFDETIAWQCPRCEKTQNGSMEICRCGGGRVGKGQEIPDASWYAKGCPPLAKKLELTQQRRTSFGYSPKLGPRWTDYYEYTYACSVCVQCDECRKPLNNINYEYRINYKVKEDTDVYVYVHAQCFPKWIKVREANEARQQEEKKRKEDEERQKQEAIQQEKIEAERQRRIHHSLCTECARALSFSDKLMGRVAHKGCR